jgi:putative cell wall-binding protein
MRKMSFKRILSYFSLFVFLVSITTINSKISAKASGTTITYSTDKNTLAAGAYFDIFVNVNNLSNLYSASIDFKFDPTLIKIENIERGSVFNNQDVVGRILADDHTNGYLSFYTSLKGSKPGINSTSGTLFVIKAQALRSGSMALNTVGDNSTLSNPGTNVRVKLYDASTSTLPIAYTPSSFIFTIGSSETLRYSGSNRYSTSVAISKAGWAQSDNIVIATGQDYPDALCATPLAGKYNAPILLTPKAALDTDVEKEIDRLKPKNVFIVGGTGVVSSAIETKLKGKGITVTRIAGANRFETSALVAKYLSSSTMAFIVTAYNYPDALSIASYAAYSKAPILLTAANKLDPSVSKIVFNGVIKNTYIIGGSGIISESLGKTLPTPKRIAGANRYETNLAILNNFNFNLSNTFVATGSHFADALSGSALAGRYGAPIILINPSMSKDVITKLREKRTSVVNIYMLGGETVVPETIINTIFK